VSRAHIRPNTTSRHLSLLLSNFRGGQHSMTSNDERSIVRVNGQLGDQMFFKHISLFQTHGYRRLIKRSWDRVKGISK